MQISLREFERTVSIDRMRTYLRHGANQHDAICLYLWNMELSQELHAILMSPEISLRNTIHVSGTVYFGRADWFREPSCVALFPEQEGALKSAKYKYWEDTIGKAAAKTQKNTLPWPPVGDHIARLMFGFWVGLMNAPYEVRLWDPSGANPNLINAAFPQSQPYQSPSFCYRAEGRGIAEAPQSYLTRRADSLVARAARRPLPKCARSPLLDRPCPGESADPDRPFPGGASAGPGFLQWPFHSRSLGWLT